MSKRKSVQSSIGGGGGGGGNEEGRGVWKSDCMNSIIHFQHLDNGTFFLFKRWYAIVLASWRIMLFQK